MTSTIKRSVCPYDCPDTCGLLVEVEDDRAVRVTGDPEHPFTRGTLCPKMNHYEHTVHSPRRLTTPLRRTGPKGSSQFEAISWDQALDTIAERWTEIIARHGAETILPYSYAGTMGLVQRNAGHPFFHRLGASRLARTICAPAKEAGWKAVMGDTPGPHPDRVADSDLVILWGINAVATNIHFLHGVREAKTRGAAVWLIDTYRTPTAAVADEVFLVRPGADAALALAMMHVLVREGLTGNGFLDEWVQGFDRLRAESLAEMPPERAAELTGLSAEAITSMAHAFGRARAPFIRVGSGLSRYGNGAMTVRCIATLPALTGAYLRPGGGCLCGTSSGGAFATKEIVREDFMPRPTRIINMNQLGHVLNDLDDPPVRSLYVYHSNPAAVAPDQNAVIRGLERSDLFTVVHERFLTDTARLADLVLPATTSLEHSDLYRAYGSYCIQRAQAAIAPVGESRSNWDTFRLLAQRLGFAEPFFRQSADQLIDHLCRLPSALRQGIDRESFEAGKAVELALCAESRERFGTPSGKIEIFNPAETEPLPRYRPTYEEAPEFPLRLMTAVTPYALNASFYEQESLRRKQGGMRLMVNPREAQRRGLRSGQAVLARNRLGEVRFALTVSEKVPPGLAVAEGIWWREFAPGERTVNALTSQRLTDGGRGSTFYDNSIELHPCE